MEVHLKKFKPFTLVGSWIVKDPKMDDKYDYFLQNRLRIKIIVGVLYLSVRFILTQYKEKSMNLMIVSKQDWTGKYAGYWNIFLLCQFLFNESSSDLFFRKEQEQEKTFTKYKQ